MKEDKDLDFFGSEKPEYEGHRMGSELVPVKLELSMIDIAALNSKKALLKSIILSDGQELDLHIFLGANPDILHAQIQEVLNEDSP